jgi:hypothetical protein
MSNPSPRPLSLSDSQLDAVIRASAPLAPHDRSAFLVAVADALRDVSVVGDGSVHRICAEQQRRFLSPPDLGHALRGVPRLRGTK